MAGTGGSISGEKPIRWRRRAKHVAAWKGDQFQSQAGSQSAGDPGISPRRSIRLTVSISGEKPIRWRQHYGSRGLRSGSGIVFASQGLYSPKTRLSVVLVR